MHKYLLYAAYGWLTFAGVMHFAIDVVSQYLRGKRLPSAETTLYYGLNSAFALGQVLLGLLGLWLAFRARDVLGELPAVTLSVVAGLGWLAIAILFMEYWQPRMTAGIFLALLVASALTR